MPSITATIFAAGLATFAQAFTQPGAQTWGPLLTPDTSSSVTQGKDFTVTWDPESHPTDGVTVSLVLCHGPGSNCVLQDTAIASGLPASQKSYDWSVPCDLAPGVQSTSTGYGMLIIVDGTGEFQYSTQFSVLANSACSGSSSASASVSASSGSTAATTTTKSGSTSSGIVVGPPAYATGSSAWSGNWTTTATGTIASGASITATATATPANPFSFGTTSIVSGSSTFTTIPASTTNAGVSATGTNPSSPTFTGGAGQVGASLAGMVVAGAVAVFAL